MHVISARGLTLQNDASGRHDGEDPLWHLMADAPRDGRSIRVKVRNCEGIGPGTRELPWLVFWDGKDWCYRTTGIALQSWHVPVAWSIEPRTLGQRERFYGALVHARAAITTFSKELV